MSRLRLFQYLIGNTDWSVIYGHNTMYIRDPEGLATAVPFDFDFSGLVNAEYAGPPPQLPIRNVRQRLYRGFCRPDLNWEALFERFEDRENAVFELIEGIPDLQPSHRKSAGNYVTRFFRDLESPERRQKRIIEGCRAPPPQSSHPSLSLTQKPSSSVKVALSSTPMAPTSIFTRVSSGNAAR